MMEWGALALTGGAASQVRAVVIAAATTVADELRARGLEPAPRDGGGGRAATAAGDGPCGHGVACAARAATGGGSGRAAE